MNAAHLEFLASERWARMLERDLLPWLLAGGSLGDDVLELGPGPSLSTEVMRKLAPAVTAVELDPGLAARLSARFVDASVEVVHGDAARTPFVAGRFSAVACFHMLHHVPTRAQQDALFVEVARVLRPGGLFLCADAVDSEAVRVAHREQGETFLPLAPQRVAERLRVAGFRDVELRTADYQLLVRATR